MKNPRYLQKQYTKLTKKLNKAFSTGRFYEYTQYKQQQLLDKFTSYTLQMKKLGMVAAVGAAVAMATPASGQIIWDTNPSYQPIATSDSLEGGVVTLVDIDADGDLDAVTEYRTYKEDSVYDNPNFYYENTGSSSAPVFTLQTGANNPFNNLTTINWNSIGSISLVDIDGDSDIDIVGSIPDVFGSFYDYLIYENRTIVLDLIKLEQKQLDLTLYPNPTTGIINLEKSITGTLEVFNTLGQVLHTEQLEEEQQINLNDLGNGTYFIKIQTSEGILQEKVVLQR